jgi:hypothetical protein
MPRMRRQPEEIGRMIRKRRKARQYRRIKQLMSNQAVEDLRLEQQFEQSLGREVLDPVFEDLSSWREWLGQRILEC